MNAEKQALEKAFKLLDQYNKLMSSNGPETQLDAIIVKLYRAGYVIRPAQVMILKDEVEFEHINPGSSEWTLHSRMTGRPVERSAKGAK